MSAPIDDRRCNDVGVNCCQEIGNEELIIENIIEDETMETTTVERELTYNAPSLRCGVNDYLQMIETEEERIEEIENEIEVKTLELDDVNNSIEEIEAQRLEEVRATYEEILSRRKEKEEHLEKINQELDERRTYLYSLYEDETEEYEVSDVDFYVNDVIEKSNNKIKCAYNFKKTYF